MNLLMSNEWRECSEADSKTNFSLDSELLMHISLSYENTYANSVFAYMFPNHFHLFNQKAYKHNFKSIISNTTASRVV